MGRARACLVVASIVASSVNIASATPEGSCRIGYDANLDLTTTMCAITAATSTAVVTGYVDQGTCDAQESACGSAYLTGPGVAASWTAGEIVADVITVEPDAQYVLSATGVHAELAVSTHTNGCEWDETLTPVDSPIPVLPTCDESTDPLEDCIQRCVWFDVYLPDDDSTDPVEAAGCVFNMGDLEVVNPEYPNRHDSLIFKPEIGYKCSSSVEEVDFWLRLQYRGPNSTGTYGSGRSWTDEGLTGPGGGHCVTSPPGDVCGHRQIEVTCTSPYMRYYRGRTSAYITLESGREVFKGIVTEELARRCDNKP